MIGIILINGNVVDYTAKVQIFEQITTQKNHFHKSYQDAVADGHRGRTLQSTTMGVCLLSKFWKNTNYAEHFYGPAHFSHPITTQPKWVPAPAWPPIFNRQKYFTNGRRRIDFFQSSRLLVEKTRFLGLFSNSLCIKRLQIRQLSGVANRLKKRRLYGVIATALRRDRDGFTP